MTEDEEKRLTLSREDLYELVWSKAMRELAKDFGISDVTLAKRCRRLASVGGCAPRARKNGQRPLSAGLGGPIKRLLLAEAV